MTYTVCATNGVEITSADRLMCVWMQHCVGSYDQYIVYGMCRSADLLPFVHPKCEFHIRRNSPLSVQIPSCIIQLNCNFIANADKFFQIFKPSFSTVYRLCVLEKKFQTLKFKVIKVIIKVYESEENLCQIISFKRD